MKNETKGILACISLLLLIGFTGCQSKQVAESESEIGVLWDQFEESWNQMDASATVTIYADDVVLIPAQMAQIVGKPAVEEFYASLFSSNQSTNYNHTTQSITSWSGHAVEQGRFDVEWVTNDGEPWTFSARTLVHWENLNGEWKIRTLMFNQPAAEESQGSE